MQFDAGTWWLVGVLLTFLIGALGWMVKRSLDKIERKLDNAATKAESIRKERQFKLFNILFHVLMEKTQLSIKRFCQDFTVLIFYNSPDCHGCQIVLLR